MGARRAKACRRRCDVVIVGATLTGLVAAPQLPVEHDVAAADRGASIRRAIRTFLVLGWVALASVAGTACSEPDEMVLEPVVRLWDERATASPVGARPVRCEVGDEYRPALGCPLSLPTRARFERKAGRSFLVAKTPARLRGKPVVVVPVLSRLPGRPGEHLPVRLIAKAGKQIRIGLPGPKPGKRATGQIRFYALERPRRTFTTGSVRVPADARLTVGLAVSAFAEKAEAGPTTFRLSARWDGGEAILLTESIGAEAGGQWLDRSLSLKELSGREVRFHFETTASGLDGSRRSATFPLWGSPEILAPAPRRRRHNLILISLDTVRADALGGETRGARLSPWFDRLAAEGTSFREAVSTYASTTAAHMSLFTATYPNRHRVRTAVNRLTAEITTLPEVLAGAGYSTGAVTENAMILASSGFARGFDEYVENRDSLEHTGAIDATFGAGLRWLEQHREEVFFLFLHTYEAHDPYQPKPEALAAVPDLEVAADASEQQRRWALSQRAYEAEVHYADGALERLFSDLRRLDLLDDTLVVITSDHGEEFGEHGALGHVRTVYDEILRIPLLFWGPKLVPAGKIVDDQVSLVDVAPTLMDLLDLPTPPGVSGRSFAGLIEGEKLKTGPRFAETHFRGVRTVAARTETHKWIWMDNGEPLRAFDLRTDPLERTPLNDPALLQRGQVLIDEYNGTKGGLIDEASKGGGLVDDPDTPLLDEAVREKLRALGYLDE